MAEPIKSAVLVDYDSLHRSLTAADGEVAPRLAGRAGGWVAAIESGQLIGPDGTRRQISIRRCYAGPDLSGTDRDALAAAGFEIVDCTAGANEAREAHLHVAMDAMDAFGPPIGCDEVILLSGAAVLGPLLNRLKASNRRAVIYADASMAPDYRALAGTVLESTSLLEFLSLDEAAAEAASSAANISRNEIEAFARKIHAATSIPLFSPKTFAELFRYLAEEIAESGYHFQTTAKHVADRLAESGRSVTRRQVVFIVKGLALKGHVFSTNDTPRRLAEVFLEQAGYLISNAGLTLDEQQNRLLTAWLVSRVPFASPASAVTIAKAAAAKIGADGAHEPPKPASEPPRASPDQKSAAAETKPAPDLKPTIVMPPANAPTPPAKEQADTPRHETRASPAMITPEDAKAAITARLPASVKMRTASRPAASRLSDEEPGTKRESANAGTLPVTERTAARAKPKADQADDQGEPESIESSILAAIAQAVDVLVEDSGSGRDKAKRQPAASPAARRAPPPREKPRPSPKVERDTASDGGDIGDEIQRIIASYTRNRKSEPPA